MTLEHQNHSLSSLTLAKSLAGKPRKWLSINPAGATCSLELSKFRIHHSLGIQLRDLRLLDPALAASYPSAILARDRSLVVNLESIKMIIGLDQCFITNLEDPSTTAFVEELQHRLTQPVGSAASMGVNASTAALGAHLQAAELGETNAEPVYSSGMPAGTPAGTVAAATAAFGELPFELSVLEAALDFVSGYLEQQGEDLEAAAHLALDTLTLKITTGNLERVRRIKSRMVRLITKVETLKELLEKLLDDDDDLKDINLSAKELEREETEHKQSLRRFSSAQAANTPFDVPLTSNGRLLTEESLASINRVPVTPGVPSEQPSFSSVSSDDEDAAVVEQLLEPYFMKVDQTWNKLSTLAEFIDDTEDFINIKLDSQRNQLIRLDLVLTAFACSMAFITAITSLFAMNVSLTRTGAEAGYGWFISISVTAACLAILTFTGVIVYCRWKRIL